MDRGPEGFHRTLPRLDQAVRESRQVVLVELPYTTEGRVNSQGRMGWDEEETTYQRELRQARDVRHDLGPLLRDLLAVRRDARPDDSEEFAGGGAECSEALGEFGLEPRVGE